MKIPVGLIGLGDVSTIIPAGTAAGTMTGPNPTAAQLAVIAATPGVPATVPCVAADYASGVCWCAEGDVFDPILSTCVTPWIGGVPNSFLYIGVAILVGIPLLFGGKR